MIYIFKAELSMFVVVSFQNQFFISGLSDDDVIQNHVLEALYRRILRAHKEETCFRVIVVIPLLPGFQILYVNTLIVCKIKDSGYKKLFAVSLSDPTHFELWLKAVTNKQGRLDDGGAATVRAIMHWQYRTISRGHNSILHNLNALLGPKTEDYISFYGLRTYSRLGDDGPIVTSQVYVHSKVMIVDNHITCIGSSNINDKSLLGHRDSEIGVLIEDREFTESTMNGESWSTGKFTNSLRLCLWSEHLGLHGEEISCIRDPMADNTYKDLWLATAKVKNHGTKAHNNFFVCFFSFDLQVIMLMFGRKTPKFDLQVIMLMQLRDVWRLGQLGQPGQARSKLFKWSTRVKFCQPGQSFSQMVSTHSYNYLYIPTFNINIVIRHVWVE
ncbi:putative phospholipase D [Helianthus annuus]|nr:putative phospholipase D [Helianthus annuus]